MGRLDDKTIYAVQHNKTKRIYVGCSRHYEKRIREHIGNLRNNRHTNVEMQKDYNRFGEDYSFFVLERNVNYWVCFDREREWMCILKSNEINTGYNLMVKEKPITISDFNEVLVKIGKQRKRKFSCIE